MMDVEEKVFLSPTYLNFSFVIMRNKKKV